MKTIKNIIILLGAFIVIISTLFSCGVIWKSPDHYSLEKHRLLKYPIMDMQAYEQIIQTHRRPYIYSLTSSNGGEALIIGVEHSTDMNEPQFDTIKKLWEETNPTVALVEGRLGFLFTWFHNPIQKYGESGLVVQLSKENNTELFTWEPTREDEIKILIEEFPPEQIALFYSFRPYFSNMRYGRPDNPEKKLQGYLESRTDYKYIRDIYTSWEELDSVWQKDFPEIKWRNYSDANGWPEGYLNDIANASNLSRDYHMVQAIIELVEKGEQVFITMGVSHAPRVENTLKAMTK